MHWFLKRIIFHLRVLHFYSIGVIMTEQPTIAQVGATEEPVFDPVICYVLVRVDAPDMQFGKVCAQVHHNGCELVETVMMLNDPGVNALYEEWKEDRLFGTVLTIGVEAAEMRQFASFATILGLHNAITHDPTYPMRYVDGGQTRYVTAPVDTCGFIFGRKSECAKILGNKNLLSERDIFETWKLKER